MNEGFSIRIGIKDQHGGLTLTLVNLLTFEKNVVVKSLNGLFSLPFLSIAKATNLFAKHTKSLVWGMQTRAVQGMLDFDYVCSRDEPSVAAMVYPFT